MKPLSTRQEKEAYIEWQLKQATQPLGYALGPPVPRRAERVWCFSRPGTHFKTEMLCAELRWRPRKAMSIDFYGSMHPHDYLARNGLTRNAGGFNLHYYQVDHLNRDGDALLEPEFALGDERQWPVLFDRLVAEIAFVDQRIWPDLRRAWDATLARESAES